MFTPDDKLYALRYFEDRCAVCGNPLDGKPHKVAWDHWVPRSSGDSPGTIPGNMVPLCKSCNSNKYAKTPREWLIAKHGAFLAGVIEDRIVEFFKTVRVEEPQTQKDDDGYLSRYVKHPKQPHMPTIILRPLPEPPDMERRLSIIYDLAHKAYRDHMAQTANDVLAPTKKERADAITKTPPTKE